MKVLNTPFSEEEIKELNVGDMIYISGSIFCGRDAVLPKIVKDVESDENNTLQLEGSAIFHTAVSGAGLGPTSSNKLEIEESIIPLSKYGAVKMHIGKGKISQNTISELANYNAVYAVIPPVTALLKDKTSEIECVAYEELGMEALYKIKISEYPVIIAAAKGRSIY